MPRTLRSAMVLLAAGTLCACQSPTNPNSTTDFIQVTANPDPATASGPTGKFYKIPGDSTHADQILEYDWIASFSLSVTLTQDATSDKVGVVFPVDLTALTIKVQQASGGIVTPPTGGDVEHYEFVTQASSNRFAAVNSTVNVGFQVWYDLPSLRKESLITVNMAFKDQNGATFSKSMDVKVAP